MELLCPLKYNKETLLSSTSKPKLYVLSELHPEAIKHAQSLFECVLHTDCEASNWRENATAILVRDHQITAADLDAAPQLRAIGKHGVGLEMVDTEACKQRGIKVFNTPGVNAGAVAELTLCLALCDAREISQIVMRQQVHAETIRKETVSGLLLTGKTIGIISMGNIGREVARMFHHGLRAKVIAYYPSCLNNSPGWNGVPYLHVHNLDELLVASDIVSVHVPLTPKTKDLILYP